MLLASVWAINDSPNINMCYLLLQTMKSSSHNCLMVHDDMDHYEAMQVAEQLPMSLLSKHFLVASSHSLIFFFTSCTYIKNQLTLFFFVLSFDY